MANVNNVKGFLLVGSIGGAYMPQGRWYQVWADASDVVPAIVAGDMVIADAGDAGYVDIHTASSTDEPLLGACLADVDDGGISPVDILVCDDPNAVYEAQCSGTLTQAMILTDVEIDGTTGIMEVDENDSTNPVITILELVDRPDNALGLNADVLVKIQRHALGSSTVDGG